MIIVEGDDEGVGRWYDRGSGCRQEDWGEVGGEGSGGALGKGRRGPGEDEGMAGDEGSPKMSSKAMATDTKLKGESAHSSVVLIMA